MDHIDVAIHAVVHDSALKAKEIAQRMGLSHQVLLNKANPQCETHKLTLREAVALQLITGDTRIHEAVGAELGLSRRPMETPSIMQAVLIASCEHGDVVNSVQHALSDGRLTMREREVCQREISEAVKALQVLSEALVAN